MSSLTGNTGFNNGSRQSKQISMKPKGYGQYSNYTPEQHEVSAQRRELSGPDSYLSKIAGGDEDAFNQIEAPAFRQFQGLQGQIASRFSGLGGKGSLSSRRSSGFQNTMNQASSDFAQDLQAKRHTMRQDAIKSLQGMYGDILGEKPYELYEKQNKPKTWQNIVGAAAPIVGGAAGGFFGGPAGAMAGYQAGNALGGAVRGA